MYIKVLITLQLFPSRCCVGVRCAHCVPSPIPVLRVGTIGRFQAHPASPQYGTIHLDTIIAGRQR